MVGIGRNVNFRPTPICPLSRLLTCTAASAREARPVGFADEDAGVPGALERSRIEYELLLRESLTLAAAAKALRVNPSRLRQRLTARPRTLFGIKEGRAWRLPKFQFEARGRLVRGIEKVIPRIRPDAHPLAVQSWFLAPHQDLVMGPDEQPVSPREWLRAAKPPDVVADLAAEI